jgi:acyl carrier protein
MEHHVDPEILRALLLEELHVEVPSVDTDLLESGALDSVQLVDLLLIVEQRFGLGVPLESIEPGRLRSLASLAELVGVPQEPTFPGPFHGRQGLRHG